VGDTATRPLFEPGHPAIVALWHCSLIYTLFHFRHNPGVIMVSGSRDGEWVAGYLARWGQIPVRGSRHKGGLEAIREMARMVMEERCNAGIVADGSKGPARIAQKGAVILARETALPIVPTGVAARPAYRFHSWDRTLMPYPRARVAMVYGTPMTVPQDVRGPVVEEYRKGLENALNAASQAAEEMLSF